MLLPYFDECSANLGDGAKLFEDVVALCQTAKAQGQPSHCRCTDPGAPCWPSGAAWNQLNASVGGRLLVPDWAGFKRCFGSPASDLAGCASAVGKSRSNNFMNQLHAGLTESTGWQNGWDAAPSAYAVEAATVADIQAAVRFAAAHDLRLVIKGTGHDYKGRSTAPDSLLIWTHLMRDISWRNDQITVGAGTTWDEVYLSAQKRGRMVVGGGCTSVGAAGGFALGGGMATGWTRRYGTASENIVSVVLVTADGEVQTVDDRSDPDLIWALRGGGGGTFGVAVSITYKSHPFRDVKPGHTTASTINCPDPDSYQKVVAAFANVARENLISEHWGGIISFQVEGGAWGYDEHRLKYGLSYYDRTNAQAFEDYRPLLEFMSSGEAKPCTWAPVRW